MLDDTIPAGRPGPVPPPDSATGASMEDAATIAGPNTVRAEAERAARSEDAAGLPESIGHYRILSKLGEGGMGIVYEAEQQFPRRLVALKVVRGGRVIDENMVRAFRREVETLARLRHPNIGGIYESGRTDDGQYFFAMELVRGDHLDVFLSRRAQVMTTEEVRFRLGLFRRIAEAVHYAHQRGVIHRDLKPSNIIISRDVDSETSINTLSGARLPDVKILDFGLARITESDVQATQVTEVGVIKGTLPYMSPEQARGNADAIDVRTDVYALGVILYEMLSNAKPYDVSRSSLLEAVRVICEQQPRSLRSTISGSRRLDPDIETLVGKALEKDAERRYSSAAAMAEDVERYLSSQPILARPPSTLYQLQKFAARNRALVFGIAATFVVLLAGIVVSTREALRANRAEALATSRMARAEYAEAMALARSREADEARALAEQQRTEAELQRTSAVRERTGAVRARTAAETSHQQARLEAAKAGAISRFLQDMLATADPWAGGGGKVTLDAALEQAQTRIGKWAGSDPEVDYAIRGTVASALAGVGKYAEAESLLRAGIDQLNRDPNPRMDLVAGLQRNLGRVLSQTANYGVAEQQFRSALASEARAVGGTQNETSALIMNEVASSLARQGRYAEADTLSLAALRLVRRNGGPASMAAPAIMRTRAYIEANWRENFAGADSLLLASFTQLSTRTGDRGLETSEALEELAANRVRMGDLAGADSLYGEAVAIRRRNLGDNHPLVARALENQGTLLYRAGRADQSLEVMKQVLAIRQQGLGPQSEDVGRTWLAIAPVYARAGKVREAQTAYETGIGILKTKLGARHPDLASAYRGFSDLRIQQRRMGDAEKLAREGLSIRLESLGKTSRGTVDAQVALADILRAKRLTSANFEAEALLLAARKSAVEARGARDPDALRATQALIQLYDGWHKPAEAAKWRAVLSGGPGTSSAAK
ncbi:MAG: tetratricopeptide repeat protein [Candidatus Eisenbacteria bacterium]|nr:tetratricopeptide repeat protein [Candidatus Eisenbacteria bacterium]